MAELVHRRIRMHGEEYFHGVTLFVPHDRGFGTDTFFDEDCWGTHLLRGPYLYSRIKMPLHVGATYMWYTL